MKTHTYNLRPRKNAINEFDVSTVLNLDEGKDRKPRPQMTDDELKQLRRNLIHTKKIRTRLKKYSDKEQPPPKWFMKEILR